MFDSIQSVNLDRREITDGRDEQNKEVEEISGSESGVYDLKSLLAYLIRILIVAAIGFNLIGTEVYEIIGEKSINISELNDR